MFFYPFYQWLLFFFTYCFLGWVWETSFVSVREHRFVNRGFLYGPQIPIYGFGALIMLFTTLPFKGNYVAVYFVGLISATILELFTGLAMEKIFKVKYWDYSEQKIQFKGYICLTSSLFWGFLSVVLVHWIHAFFEGILFSIPKDIQYVLVITIAAGFLTDLGFSLKSALDMRRVIITLEKLRDEMERIRDDVSEKIDQTVDDISERIDQTVDEFSGKLDETKTEIAEKLGQTKEELVGKFEEAKDGIAERIDQTVDNISEKVDQTVDEFTEKLDQTKDEFAEKIDQTRKGITEKIDQTKEEFAGRTKAVKDSIDQQQEALKKLTESLIKRNPTAKLPTLKTPRVENMVSELKERLHRH